MYILAAIAKSYDILSSTLLLSCLRSFSLTLVYGKDILKDILALLQLILQLLFPLHLRNPFTNCLLLLQHGAAACPLAEARPRPFLGGSNLSYDFRHRSIQHYAAKLGQHQRCSQTGNCVSLLERSQLLGD